MKDGTNHRALFAVLFPIGLVLFSAGFCVYRQKFMVAVGLDSSTTGKPSLAFTYQGAWPSA